MATSIDSLIPAEVRAMRDPRAMPPAILASILAHLALVAAVALTPARSRDDRATAPPEPEPVDVWAGTSAELPGAGGRTYDVDVDRPGAIAPARPAAPPPAAAVPEPKPAPKPEPASAPPPDTDRGEAPAPQPAAAQTAKPPASEPKRPNRKAPAASSATGAPSAGSAGEGSGRGEFGAEGAGAVRSLGRAFTRAIPPACQADPAWRSLPAGNAGTARVVLEIDEAGHIAGWKPDGTAPAKHLENLVKRTVALLASGTFAVHRGSVTAGKQTLEISAAVSDVEAAEEGAADSLAWRFENGRGAASFTQANGRHVEITLRVIRTEVAPTAPPG